MELIKINDKTFEPYVSAKELNQIAERMASEVYQDLQESRPIFIAVLNGSFMFAADFLRHYKGECEISFVKMASYQGTQSTGKIHQLIGLSTPVEGRDVVILEDIIDTGNTLEEIYRLFENQKVKSFRIATLFFKPDAYKKDLKIDYVGKPIPNRFIVGYGLDFDEIARNLPQVYQLNTSLTMTNLVLFGKPGAGKGTQAAFLKDKYNLVHISTGISKTKLNSASSLNHIWIKETLYPMKLPYKCYKRKLKRTLMPKALSSMVSLVPLHKPKHSMLSYLLKECAFTALLL